MVDWAKTQVLPGELADGSDNRMFRRRRTAWWFVGDVAQCRATDEDDYKMMVADGYHCRYIWELIELAE